MRNFPLTNGYKCDLLHRVAVEQAASRDWKLPVVMDVQVLMSVVAALQLALRHPKNIGPSAQIVRDVLNQIIERVEGEGFCAVAELMKLGDNADYDE